jgi:RNA polymerase sigma factor (TIGR02999 family)
MPLPSPQEVTQLLVDWRQGDDGALSQLTPLVYEDLRRLAHHYMSGQRPDHTLQTTALVHEAYLRVAGQTNPSWQTRAQFFAVAARAMRQILVNYAKSYRSQKRGGAGRSGAVEGDRRTARGAREIGQARLTKS